MASLLELPVLRRGVPEVVAGRGGLSRPVRWVHAGEVPNIASLLRGGELLLTTGMGIERGAEPQRRFVRELAERGVAALAVELSGRMASVPRAMVDEAERRGLPLIALHSEVPFVDITEAVHREIVNAQFELMRRGDELHRRFTALMLGGAGIPEVLEALAEAIGNPVVLERPGQGVLYHAPGASGAEAALAAWEAAALGLQGAPEVAVQPVPLAAERAGVQLAALAVDSEIDESDRVALERAVALIALALVRDREEERLTGRDQGNFLMSLIEGSIDDAAVRNRAAAMGFEPRGAMFPLLAARSARFTSGVVGEGAWSRAWVELRRALDERRLANVAGTRERDEEMLAVVELPDRSSRDDLMGRIAGAAAEIAERNLRDPAAIVVAAGAPATTWSGLRDSMRAAREALPAVRHAAPRAWHDLATPSLERLLWSLRGHAGLEQFAAARLAPLVEHDGRRSPSLLETLRAYLEAGGRKSEAARVLGIERQSLYHRLTRIEELLGVDLTGGDELLGLHLALRVLDGRAPGGV